MAIKRPILAITMGDPAGIGPEIAVKTFSVKEIYSRCSPLLVGNAEIIRQILKITKHDLKIRTIHQVSEAKFEYGTIDIYELPVENPGEIKYGEISKIAGDIAFRSVVKAIELANRGDVDGTVTCPINKKALNEAGHHFSGHGAQYGPCRRSSGQQSWCLPRQSEEPGVSCDARYFPSGSGYPLQFPWQ